MAHASPAAQDHANAFNLLRLLAALAVIFSHQFHIIGVRPPVWLHSDMVGGVAVMTFFTISGYLVTLSWLRDPRVLPFAVKRLLRLWPGMLVAVVADMLVFGPVFTSLPVMEFWASPYTQEHWRNLLLVKAYTDMPGVFAHNPLAGLMNGPLWTIPMEALCYGALTVAGVLGVLRWRWLASLAALLYLGFFVGWHDADFTGTMEHWFEYPAYFAFGGLIALHRDWFLRHALRVMALLAPVAALLFWGLGWQHTAGLLLLPPFLIRLGVCRAPWLAQLQRRGDPSYGIYLLGCPIAQAIKALWPDMGFATSLSLAWAVSVAAGLASWHWVESPALGLKRRWVRRGARLAV